jgi:hypothetical protein
VVLESQSDCKASKKPAAMTAVQQLAREGADHFPFQTVEYLPSKCKVLSSNPRTTKQQQQKTHKKENRQSHSFPQMPFSVLNSSSPFSSDKDSNLTRRWDSLQAARNKGRVCQLPFKKLNSFLAEVWFIHRKKHSRLFTIKT